ncbi:hypothetical protein WBG78_06080 [Chryseolinea sp. T2]|uniref:hypothetical protein n=1 Tax=Chryseolinea sp. T2 TaxID=3129255 RepID=UPI0030770533
MKPSPKLLLPLFIFLITTTVRAQWPKEITAPSGTVITIYQPQPESLAGDKVKGRAAFSAQDKTSSDPQFGVVWFTASISTDRDDRTFTLESILITDVKLPGVKDTANIGKLRTLLETEIPKWDLSGSIADLTATIEQEQISSGDDLKHDPPVIIYEAKETLLVLIDGEPKLQDEKNIKMKRVVNSAFLIVQDPTDKKYYLNGGKYWYASSSATEGYMPITTLPKSIAEIDKQLKEQAKDKQPKDKQPSEGETAPESGPPAIRVSTKPAELIQSKGQASFANIEGTNLLYVKNSDDNIFKSVDDQLYYVLLSGRWYTAQKLEGPWKYVASDKLPADFAKIPEGSDKDNVLSSVAGTPASTDAIHDAQVPQTAKVDRKKAKCTVTYDGEPKFEAIEGTSLELAMNTSSTVLKQGKKYYCVENGVWFEASAAKGPWKVSDERPKEVDKIPASSPAYNVKYVYIYETTPEVVYVGYTPGYMGCYVYGPTVVYGTGYYYSPWYGPYYYPRPVTFGFSMHYNPWTGWSMGFHYSVGFFSMSFYGGGGYWGPPMYRPPFYPPYRGGMYGGRPVQINHYGDINIDRSNNIYNNRNDVTTRDVKRGDRNPSASTRDVKRGQQNPSVSTRDAQRGQNTGVSTRDAQRNTANDRAGASQLPNKAERPRENNVYSDKNGNVYQRNENGSWNQRDGNQWKETQQSQQMNRDYQNRQRSTQQNNSFNQMNRGGNMGGSYRGGGGGGARMGGGGGRRR